MVGGGGDYCFEFDAFGVFGEEVECCERFEYRVVG